MTTAALILSGCGGGSDGAAGAPGGPGGPGLPGAPGADATATVNVATLTDAQWQALTPKIDPASIAVTINSPPVITFKVTDANGNPVTGLGGQRKASTALVPTNYNLQFTLAKLVPASNGSPSKWVSYLMTDPTKVTTAATLGLPSYPHSDNTGTLLDNKDGTYKYTFYRDIKGMQAYLDGLVAPATGTTPYDTLTKRSGLGDVSYEPTLTHRLGIIIDGYKPNTGTNTPDSSASSTPGVRLVKTFNIGYDFVPAGGTPTSTRNIVTKDSCSTCHDGKGIGHAGANVGGWQVGRNDPALCVTCHTDQVRATFDQEASYTDSTHMTLNGTTRATQAVVDGRAVGNFPNLIHKMHMGEELLKQGYNFNIDAAGEFNDKKLPQDPRNCTKCHTATATPGNPNVTTDGDNWKKVPSALACGSCHDGINFATGFGTTLNGKYPGHIGGAQADDRLCSTCHSPAAIPVYHRTTVASPNNPVVQDGVASFAYKISSVTINASNQAVVKFQVLKDGTPVAFNAYVAGGAPITGFTDLPGKYGPAGPAFLVAYATGQDTILAPSDWNSAHDVVSLTDLWTAGAAGDANGNKLTLTDAATNTYTAVIAYSVAKSHTMAVPTDAKMVTALLAGAFTDANSNALPGIPAMMAATGNTPDGKANVARRAIFSEAKCNSCHDRLGTSPNFHSGSYSIAMCAACHTPNQGGSTGWSASFRVWVHGIHSASKRTVPFTWHAVSATDNYSKLEYPGVVKDCQQCHQPGTYDFSDSQYTPAVIGGMLNVTAATGVPPTDYVPPQVGGVLAYGLVSGHDYGTGPSIDKTTGTTTGTIVPGTGVNLVSSPLTAACSSCHDGAAAISHMSGNGGSFYAPRNEAITKTEACLVCHGDGKVAAIKDVHAK